MTAPAIDVDRLLADQTWVETLISTHIELQATRHTVFVVGQQVSVEVEGAHWEARAWRHAIGGRILPSHIDRHGVRRQLVVGAHCQVQIVERPKRRDEGGVNVGLAIIVAGVGLFLWGWTHGSSRPNGAWVAAVAVVGALVLLLATGITHFQRSERRAADEGTARSKSLHQDTSGAHYMDGMD